MIGFIPDTLFLLTLTSALLAGLRRSTGLAFQTQQIQNTVASKIMSAYLTVGEFAFDRLAGFARGSRFFKVDPRAAVNGVKSQVSELKEGIIKAAAAEFTRTQ